MGNTPELQTTHWMPHGHLLVNVPITFPSSFLATDSQSCTAISAATFLALRKNRESVLLRRLCTSHISVKGRMESVCRIPTGSDYCPILLHSQGFLRGQTETHHSSCGQEYPKPQVLPTPGPTQQSTGNCHYSLTPQIQTYQSSDPSSSPAQGPCPLWSSSWNPPGPSACQTCPPGHPSSHCGEAEELH